MEFAEGDSVKIKDDFCEYNSKGIYATSWRAGAEGTYDGIDNKGRHIVKCGSPQAGYFYFRILFIHNIQKL